MQGGNLGGTMRAQDFSEDSAKAQAKDAISKFNAANTQNVQASNIADRNQAQATNLQNKQTIAAQNVTLRN